MLARAAVWLLTIYQKHGRPLMPASCRFLPTCSEYTKQAIIKYGLFAGLSKGAKRLLRCHPFSQRSWDDPLI